MGDNVGACLVPALMQRAHVPALMGSHEDKGIRKGLPLQRSHDFCFTLINRLDRVHKDIMCAL